MDLIERINIILSESPPLGVIAAPGPDMRRGPKTGYSSDYVASREKGTVPGNTSGFANTTAHYYDPLDQRNRKIPQKKSWLTRHSRIMIAGW